METVESKHQGIGNLAPDGWYTLSQASDLVGRSRETIKRWHSSGTYRATNQMRVGKLRVWVYSDEDIQNMREVAESMQFGRPRKDQKSDGGKNLTN